MECIKNDILKRLIISLMSQVNEQTVETDTVHVLIVSKAGGSVVAPIVETAYYSEDDTDRIAKNLEQIRQGGFGLEDILASEGAAQLKCAKCENDRFLIQCLLLGEAVNYYGIVQFILDEIKDKTDYHELIVEDRLNSALKHLDLDNRTIFMEKYVQRFLKQREMLSAELLIELSAQRYEGSECEARIYRDNAGIREEDKVCGFSAEKEKCEGRILRRDNLRTIRKLLELSKMQKLYLLADKDMKYITGLVAVADSDREDIHAQSNYICFKGYMCWSIYIAGKEEICYKQGKYYINSSKSKDIYDLKITEFKRRIEGKDWLTRDEILRIENLVKILKEQKHGTAVVLTDDAAEAPRLCNACRGVMLEKNDIQRFKKEDNSFDEDAILSVTGIDGALFMDLNGVCTAFGVIVDGEAVTEGNMGRGARFNSVNNYICWKSKEIENSKEKSMRYVALIFSEDGGVDIIDNFLPKN